MTTQRVIFVDPGQRAGWASATMGLNRFENVAHGVLPIKEMACMLAEIQARSLGLNWVPSYLPVDPPLPYDVIGYETWRLSANKAKDLIGDDFQASQLIGMVRLIGWLSGAKIVGYPPAAKFDHPPSEALEKRKAESSEEHDKDALDLLWHYYYVNYFDPTKEPA